MGSLSHAFLCSLPEYRNVEDTSEEKIHLTLSFIFQISLVPKSLARKRIWNKKYPICIELAKQDDFMAKAQTEKENAEEKLPAEKGDSNNEASKKPQDGAKYTCQKDQVLYLFGRTGREKEEWFRRFLLASKLKSEVKKPLSLCGSKPGTRILYSCRSLLTETNQSYVLVVRQ